MGDYVETGGGEMRFFTDTRKASPGRRERQRLERELLELSTIEEPVEEPAPLVDEDEARRLAEQRRSLERRRRGRQSLRLDAPVRNPGIASSLGSGLRIP